MTSIEPRLVLAAVEGPAALERAHGLLGEAAAAGGADGVGAEGDLAVALSCGNGNERCGWRDTRRYGGGRGGGQKGASTNPLIATQRNATHQVLKLAHEGLIKNGVGQPHAEGRVENLRLLRVARVHLEAEDEARVRLRVVEPRVLRPWRREVLEHLLSTEEEQGEMAVANERTNEQDGPWRAVWHQGTHTVVVVVVTPRFTSW